MNNSNIIQNPRFSEEILSGLREDIDKHLALLLSGWYEFIPALEDELTISDDWIIYSDFEWKELKTPQIIIILLEVAEFLYKNRDAKNINDIQKKVVLLPKVYAQSIEERTKDWVYWDLFWQLPVTHSAYCLSKAFLLLRWKLFERQTGLYHALFLKTCLMLDREEIAPGFLVWDEYPGLSWLSFVKRYVTPNEGSWTNTRLDLNIGIDGLSEYPKLSDEIVDLYLESYAQKRQEEVKRTVNIIFWRNN